MSELTISAIATPAAKVAAASIIFFMFVPSSGPGFFWSSIGSLARRYALSLHLSQCSQNSIPDFSCYVNGGNLDFFAASFSRMKPPSGQFLRAKNYSPFNSGSGTRRMPMLRSSALPDFQMATTSSSPLPLLAAASISSLMRR